MFRNIKKEKIAKYGMDAFGWKSFRLYQIIQMTPMIDFFLFIRMIKTKIWQSINVYLEWWNIIFIIN